MLYKYRLLKSSWGIAIDMELEISSNFQIDQSTVLIKNGIYLNNLDKNCKSEWINKGIFDISDLIYQHINAKTVCFEIKSINYNYTDFQEEGLYCAIQQFICEYYNITPPIVNVQFDKENNKYLFDIK